MKKIVHYLNQFYGQIGGEEFADQTPFIKEGPVGPGTGIQASMTEGTIVATVICGDNYFADHKDEALAQIMELIKAQQPDLFIAGPGFNAGRYGFACGTVCDAVKSELNIPVVTALYPENPGAEMFHKTVYILEAPDSAVGMKKLLTKIAGFSDKLLRGDAIGFPEEEGYIPQGFRVNVFTEKTGAERGVDMLIKKLRGEPFVTELPMPVFDRVDPAPAIKDLSKSTIALVTSGGIVPAGNPDRIESANATKYAVYDISGLNTMPAGDFISVHGGYDPVYATANPNRVMPLDAMRELEAEGVIGKLHNEYYVTVGNTTAVASAKKYAEEIAADLIRKDVQAVILTSN